MADPPDEEAVRDLIGRLETLLEQIERATGPVAQIATQAVTALATVYGTALGRVLALAGETPPLVSSLVRDELVGHLLILHGLHPDPPEDRIRRALDDLRPRLCSGDAELVGVEDGIARLRWSGGCGSPAAIRDAVLAAAPELRGVETVPGAPRPVIPVESLLQGPRIGPP